MVYAVSLQKQGICCFWANHKFCDKFDTGDNPLDKKAQNCLKILCYVFLVAISQAKPLRGTDCIPQKYQEISSHMWIIESFPVSDLA